MSSVCRMSSGLRSGAKSTFASVVGEMQRLGLFFFSNRDLTLSRRSTLLVSAVVTDIAVVIDGSIKIR